MTDDNETQEGLCYPGEVLKQAREEKGYTRQYVAEQLRLTVRYISSLEEGCFDKLPGPAFIRGYIRIYARLLEIPAEDLLVLLDKHFPRQDNFDPQTAIGVRPAVQLREKTIASSVLYSFIVILGLTALAWWIQGQDNEQKNKGLVESEKITLTSSDDPVDNGINDVGIKNDTGVKEGTDIKIGIEINDAEFNNVQVNAEQVSNSEDSSESEKTLAQVGNNESDKLPVTEKESVLSELNRTIPKRADYVSVTSRQSADGSGKLIKVDANGKDLLHIEFSRECWLEISNKTGDMLYADLRQANDELQLTGNSPFLVTLGNAPGVRMSFNHQQVDISPHIRRNNRAELTVGQ